MALRTFVGSDGRTWRVWLVRAKSSSLLLGRGREWLAFQTEDESERRRLRAVPAGWAQLSDERLDLLRGVAEGVRPPIGGHSAAGDERNDPDDLES
jgi:hypothetical protein